MGIQWDLVAQMFNSNGQRGSYNQFPKSVDFFTTCLHAPDRLFRHMFRYVLALSLIYLNSIYLLE